MLLFVFLYLNFISVQAQTCPATPEAPSAAEPASGASDHTSAPQDLGAGSSSQPPSGQQLGEPEVDRN